MKFYKNTAQGLALPTMLWLLLLNGAFLGVYVYQASTFAQILVAPPYSFQVGWLGFVQMAQIIDCIIMLPLLGYGSDMIVKFMSRLRNGVFEPEYRLISLAIPAVAVVCGCVLFGQAGGESVQYIVTLCSALRTVHNACRNATRVDTQVVLL